ncbi:MAG: porin [Bacteroidales bacterium]
MKKNWQGVLALLLFCLNPFNVEAETTEDKKTATEEVSGSKLSKTLDKIQEKVGNHLKFSGFILGRAQYSSQPSNYGGFDIRMLRFIGSGSITKDFDYRFQMEFAGSPRILDAWLHWKKYDFFQIRAGQQKRCFTFENPWSPVTLGMSEYAQSTLKLAGFNDRVGEHSCGGRDVGILFMGDLFKTSTHHLVHYDIGVYNGNGIRKM